MTTQLIQLRTVEDLVALRSLYERNRSEHYLGYNTLDNFINWHNSDNTRWEHFSQVHVYSLNEQSWRQRGLYLIVHECQLFVNSTHPEDDDLAIAMHMLDWRRGYKITSVPSQQLRTVTKALQALEIQWCSARMNIFRLPIAKLALRQRIALPPPGLSLRTLRPHDAEVVDMAWPSRHTGSLAFIKCLITYNQSVGVFCDDTKEPIAWCTRCQCGFLGTLHVQPSHRRQGIATLLVETFAERIAATKQQDIFALVYERNSASNELFRKLDYDAFGHVYHIRAFRDPGSFE